MSTTSPATSKLAPNAIVLLAHLCYASGNSESGKPLPSAAQARQRVDNMAAGWLKAGARAVVAEAHFGPAWYVHQLFTTHATVDQLFHESPTFNDKRVHVRLDPDAGRDGGDGPRRDARRLLAGGHRVARPDDRLIIHPRLFELRVRGSDARRGNARSEAGRPLPDARPP